MFGQTEGIRQVLDDCSAKLMQVNGLVKEAQTYEETQKQIGAKLTVDGRDSMLHGLLGVLTERLELNKNQLAQKKDVLA